MAALYMIDFSNGKKYVGITRGIASNRFRQHLKASKRGDEGLLCRALRTHSFDLKILADDNFDWELLCLMETEAIDKWKTKSPTGYNLTDGGEGVVGAEFSEQRRQKIGKRIKEFWATPQADTVRQERRERYKDPKQREVRSQRAKEQFKDPRQIERVQEQFKALWQDPEYRSRQIESSKSRWEDPAYREKCSSGLRIRRQAAAEQATCRLALAECVQEKRSFSWLDK